MINIRTLFLEFVIFSIFGYILECLYCSFLEKKLVLNRGFLRGPYCPIYGTSVLIVYFMIKGVNSLLLKFLMASFLVAFIEYLTGFLLEKIFSRTWWNYSRKKFNIKGRVCLDNMIFFGIGATLVARKTVPFMERFFVTDSNILYFSSFLLFIIFIIDLFLSLRRHFLESKMKY